MIPAALPLHDRLDALLHDEGVARLRGVGLLMTGAELLALQEHRRASDTMAASQSPAAGREALTLVSRGGTA